MADEEVEALWALVRQRYGSRLTDEQLTDLRTSVEGLVGAARELRRVSLSNADAPLERLVPFRAAEGP
jgi:hypothetical protein